MEQQTIRALLQDILKLLQDALKGFYDEQ